MPVVALVVAVVAAPIRAPCGALPVAPIVLEVPLKPLPRRVRDLPQSAAIKGIARAWTSDLKVTVLAPVPPLAHVDVPERVREGAPPVPLPVLVQCALIGATCVVDGGRGDVWGVRASKSRGQDAPRGPCSHRLLAMLRWARKSSSLRRSWASGKSLRTRHSSSTSRHALSRTLDAGSTCTRAPRPAMVIDN